MQEQEGERRGVGEKNKRRMGGEGGCELEREKERERKEEKSTESNVAEKGTQRAQAWNRREREKQEGNFAYLLYPGVSAFNPYAATQEAKSHN